MSYQERQVASSLIASLIIFTAYFLWLWRASASGYFDGPDASRLAGIAICVLIGGGCVVHDWLFNSLQHCHGYHQ